MSLAGSEGDEHDAVARRDLGAPAGLDSHTLAPLPRSSAATTVTATLASIAALWWGQRFLIPVVAGLMLALVLAPLVTRVARAVHSLSLATVLALCLFIAVLTGAALSFGGHLLRVADRVPEMISLAAHRMSEGNAEANSVLARARDALQELDRAAETWTAVKGRPRGSASRPGALVPKTGQAAVPVVLAASAPTPISDTATVALKESAATGSTALLKLVGELSIIVFVAFFVLVGGASLATRFLDQWGYHPKARQRAEHALRECSRQVRLSVGVLLVANIVIGCVVWAAFTIGGLPDAAGWGVAAAVLHIVPYVGMVVLTALGAAETFLVHGTLSAALGMAGALVISSTLIGTFVTAWLQGRAAKMNAAAVFIGLVFWGALWGVWGLFLGPALVVVLKVVAEHSRSGQRLALLLKG